MARMKSDELFDLAAQQHGVVSRSQAARLGLTRYSVRRAIDNGRLEPVGVHVLRAPGAPMTWSQLVMSAVLEAPDGAAASHVTAAALWRIPGFRRSRPHIAVRHPVSHRGIPLGTVHLTRDLPDEHLAKVDGIPVTSAARTLFDLAASVHPARLARGVDNAVAMQLTSYAELCELRDHLAKRGRPGSTRFRMVMAERDARVPAPESELEARFLALIRDYGLPEPERQVVLGDDADIAGRVDFYFRRANLIVELDGARHHSSLLDREADARRDLLLVRGGRRVLRLTWHQVTNESAEVAMALQDVLRAAA
jgi:very-short-patch-repair endonuclease